MVQQTKEYIKGIYFCQILKIFDINYFTFDITQKHYSIKYNGSQNTYEKLLEYLRLVNEENPENKAEQEYRKVNLFV